MNILIKYKDDDKMKKTLFLLTIRTALSIWHFAPSKSHSIILLIPKRLMTRTPFSIKNGWIFVGFYSKINDDLKWKRNIIKDVDFYDDKTFIENSIEEFNNEKDYFHVLTDFKSKTRYNFLQTQIFETIFQLLPDIEFDPKNFQKISNISFSKNYFRIFIEIVLKIYYRHFCILQGETGCGKSSLIQLLNDILTFVKRDPKTMAEVNWNISTISFHGSFNINDFDNEIKRLKHDHNINCKEAERNVNNERNIVFLDHFNKSPAYYYVINYAQESNNEYISYIAAINPYAKLNSITRELSCGIQQQQKNIHQHSRCKLFEKFSDDMIELTKSYDSNNYLYNVKKPQESMMLDVILVDPEEFDEENQQYLIYDKLNSQYSLCFSDEEKSMIRLIIANSLKSENNRYIEMEYIVDLLSELISDIFITVRLFMKLRAIFSYRDVFRCTTIFKKIFDYFIKKKVDMNLPKHDKRPNEFWYKVASIAAVISIYVSLISRFPREEINTNRLIAERFKHHPFIDVIGSNHQTICVYKLVLDYISNKNRWPSGKLPHIENWEQVTLLFAYAKCAKYIINETKIVYPLPSLMLHLLILSFTVSASFHDKNSNNFFNCLITGMPGTSKLKAVELYKKYHIKKASKKDNYFFTTYLCSKTSIAIYNCISYK